MKNTRIANNFEVGFSLAGERFPCCTWSGDPRYWVAREKGKFFLLRDEEVLREVGPGEEIVLFSTGNSGWCGQPTTIFQLALKKAKQARQRKSADREATRERRKAYAEGLRLGRLAMELFERGRLTSSFWRGVKYATPFGGYHQVKVGAKLLRFNDRNFANGLRMGISKDA